MPASGKPHTASPSPSSRRAVRYAAAGASRSTGMCFIRSIGPASARWFQMSWRVMNRRLRPRWIAAFSMKTKSG